jgi:diadenylate cyclase
VIQVIPERISMVLEIAFFATGIYIVLRFLRATRGSGVIRGLSLILVGGLIAFTILINVLQLRRLGLVFESLRDIAVVGLIIVFQPEIRRAIVHLGESPIFNRFFRREIKTMQRLIRAVARMSKERTGALIAIERDGSLSAYAEQGIHLDAELNSFLVECIFHKGSALHDGAMILRGDRIVAASCVLPLSDAQNIDRRLGTRHRAALGLAEETDALAIIVSEETGKVSIAFGGELQHDISLETLERTIEKTLGSRKGAE